MKVWLDDIRPKPPAFDVRTQTAAGAIALLRTGNVTHISLDHDLGPHGSGYDVACEIEQLAEKSKLKCLYVLIHTQNVVGRRRITSALLAAVRRGAPIYLIDRLD